MTRIQRTPIYTRDSDLEEIVLVPLANHDSPAKIFPKDFEAVVAAGHSEQWTFNAAGPGHRYVRCASHDRQGNLATVARLILNAPPGRIVKYRDNDRLNLRRDNLFLTEGRAPGVTMKDEELGAAA